MNNAIIYLLNHTSEDIIEFKKSLNLLKINYLNRFPCKLICFHESEFPKSEIQVIKNIYSDIIFHELNWKLRDYPIEIKSKILDFFPHPEPIHRVNGHGFSMGYRHMCRMFAGQIYQTEYLKEYEYVWRLDTDSFIQGNINYDVFQRMKDNDSIYGYINIQHDHPEAIIGLWKSASNYFENVYKKPTHIDINKPEHHRRVFYTNFEIKKVSWFASGSYKDFFNYIDDVGGIYLHRWGDAPIKYIGVNSLCPPNQILFFNDIKYQHAGVNFHNKKIINTY